jgi:neutral ceramidase
LPESIKNVHILDERFCRLAARRNRRITIMSAIRGPLYAGVAKVDITPQDLTGLTNLWRTPFEGVHDDIYLRALVVDNGTETAAIVAADLLEFGDTSAVRERVAREVGIPADHIIITASHDHNAPRVGTVSPGASAYEGGPATQAYTKVI